MMCKEQDMQDFPSYKLFHFNGNFTRTTCQNSSTRDMKGNLRWKDEGILGRLTTDCVCVFQLI